MTHLREQVNRNIDGGVWMAEINGIRVKLPANYSSTALVVRS